MMYRLMAVAIGILTRSDVLVYTGLTTVFLAGVVLGLCITTALLSAV